MHDLLDRLQPCGEILQRPQYVPCGYQDVTGSLSYHLSLNCSLTLSLDASPSTGLS